MKNTTPSIFDLSSTCEQGGCAAKIAPKLLSSLIRELPVFSDEALLVGTETSDDAAVYKLTDEIAIIQTTDFFPPVCSDPYDFGQIAAANAMSDVYAMGGTVTLALNIVMFPASTLDIQILKEILRGGADKLIEAGAVLAGGHTIEDPIPKYGLAVTGVVHPSNIITNRAATNGDLLILTKRVGTGVILSGKRVKMVSESGYQIAIDSMKQLNGGAPKHLHKYGVRCATDVTGFGLLGHALEIAEGSGVSLEIFSAEVPIFDEALSLIEEGCIPGGCFRNLKEYENKLNFSQTVPYNVRMALVDPQTSGGLLICVSLKYALLLLCELKNAGYHSSAVIGRVTAGNSPSVINIL